MTNKKKSNRNERPNGKAKRSASRIRRFEAETVALQSLRLIAAPNPKDDLSDEEIARMVHKSSHSTELIIQLIDYIKTI